MYYSLMYYAAADRLLDRLFPSLDSEGTCGKMQETAGSQLEFSGKKSENFSAAILLSFSVYFRYCSAVPLRSRLC